MANSGWTCEARPYGVGVQVPLQEVLEDLPADHQVHQRGGCGRPGGFGPTDNQADEGLTPPPIRCFCVAGPFGLLAEQSLHLITQRRADRHCRQRIQVEPPMPSCSERMFDEQVN